MKQYIFPKELIALSKDILKDIYKDKIVERTRQIKKLNREMKSLEKRIETLFDKYLDGEIQKELYRSKNSAYEKNRDKLQEELNSLNL